MATSDRNTPPATPVSATSIVLGILAVIVLGALLSSEIYSFERLKALDRKLVRTVNGLNQGKKLIPNDVDADYQLRLRLKEIQHQLKHGIEEDRRRIYRIVLTAFSLVIVSVAAAARSR